MPLLLAPAGSMQALKAAIDAGADEIYLGGSEFNARINAANFNRDDLLRARKLCDGASVGMHITLNTLIFDKEFKAVLDYVDFLANDVHPDAIIIQDLGLASVIRKQYPDLPLHASTQMRIHSFGDAKYLKSLGFTRAVLARELPKEDIKAFADTGLETEIFVHGAICVSESGGCLMSSVIGNRSGNRGECAQPCRLPYRAKEKFALSVKDMCLAGRMTEVFETGVTSLKIEGRMKAPEYVSTVVSIYRRLIDERRNATQKEIEILENVFSRSGFTDGYFKSKINKSMFGVRTELDKQKSELFKPKLPVFCGTRRKHEQPKPTPIIIPTRDEEKTLHPAKQKGFVFRFEGKLPSKQFLEKYAHLATRIDLPLDCCIDERFTPYFDKVSAVLPRSIFLSEAEKVKKKIASCFEKGIRNATISNLYQADLCKGFYLHGDYAFNVVNRESIAMLENYSFSSVMLSPETDGKFARGSRCALEYIGYGRTPVMFTRTCIICNTSGCKNKEKCFDRLIDRTGAAFPIISGPSHTNTIYNSLPAYRLDKRAELKKAGVGLITLLFTDESEAKMAEIIELSQSKEKPKFEYTRR